MIDAHIFYYKWPRLQLEPQYEVRSIDNFAQITAPANAYIYANYQWHQQTQVSIRPIRYITRLVETPTVPAAFRALALIAVP